MELLGSPYRVAHCQRLGWGTDGLDQNPDGNDCRSVSPGRRGASVARWSRRAADAALPMKQQEIQQQQAKTEPVESGR